MDMPASWRSSRPGARPATPGTTGRSPTAGCRRWEWVVGVDLTAGLFDAGLRLAADAAVFGSMSQ
jgi:hypothetical protein